MRSIFHAVRNSSRPRDVDLPNECLGHTRVVKRGSSTLRRQLSPCGTARGHLGRYSYLGDILEQAAGDQGNNNEESERTKRVLVSSQTCHGKTKTNSTAMTAYLAIGFLDFSFICTAGDFQYSVMRSSSSSVVLSPAGIPTVLRWPRIRAVVRLVFIFLLWTAL